MLEIPKLHTILARCSCIESSGLQITAWIAEFAYKPKLLVKSRDNPTLVLAHGVVTVMRSAGDVSRLVVRWVEVNLEGLAAVACKADLGGDPAADQHDMG